MTSFKTLFDQELKALRHTAEHMEGLACAFEALSQLCLSALQQGKKILFFGNGGSAADAQHLAAELVVRLCYNRPAIPAIALTTDTSVLTAVSNDWGFENLFARQIEALGHQGDIAFGITTSGRSANVLKGLAQAQKQGLKTVALTGHDGDVLTPLTDALIRVPSTVTARIQEMHIWLGHTLCSGLETALYPLMTSSS